MDKRVLAVVRVDRKWLTEVEVEYGVVNGGRSRVCVVRDGTSGLKVVGKGRSGVYVVSRGRSGLNMWWVESVKRWRRVNEGEGRWY